MSTVDEREDGGLTVHAKGAPEEVLERSTAVGDLDHHRPITDGDRNIGARSPRVVRRAGPARTRNRETTAA